MAQNEEVKFKVTDPRNRVIICTAECWYRHILSERPWMEKYEDRVIATISNPNIGIFRDADFENRQVYYRRQGKKKRYLKVVIEFSSEKLGRVVTAFPTDSMKPGEKWIGPQSNVS